MYRIGLLGASWIAPQAILDPASILPGFAVTAVAARHAERVKAYAALHAIPKAYDSYDALLADPDIDIIYISLPPSHHAVWSIRALQAGKHVICEKPTAMNLTEATAMVDAAKATGKRLIEAFHSRYHPAFETCLSWVSTGRIGQITSLSASFGVPLEDDGRKNQYRPELGGGSITDMGCYPLHWVTNVMGTPVTDVTADAVLAASGVDESFQATLTFPNNVCAEISSSMHPSGSFAAWMDITGTKGQIRFQNPLVPHQGGALTCVVDDVTHEASVSTISTYAYQLQAIGAALHSGRTLPTEGAALLTQQSMIDRLYAAAGLGHLRATTYTG